MPNRFEFPERLVKQAQVSVTKKISQNIGLRPEDMGPAMHEEIGLGVQAALEKRFATEVVAISDSHFDQFAIGQQDVGAAITTKVGLGAKAITAMLTDDKFGDILAKNAEMMKRKFDALVTAGFTAEQAFRLIEAEVYSKGTSRPK